ADPEQTPAAHVGGRWVDSVECAPLNRPGHNPRVYNSHPAQNFFQPRALGERESHQAADDRAANVGSGHIPVLNADFFGRDQLRSPPAERVSITITKPPSPVKNFPPPLPPPPIGGKLRHVSIPENSPRTATNVVQRSYRWDVYSSSRWCGSSWRSSGNTRKLS